VSSPRNASSSRVRPPLAAGRPTDPAAVRSSTLKLVARVPKSDLEGGKLLRLEYDPFDVLITLVDGQPYAIEDACNHAGASLAEGWLEGDRVVCPLHGYVFSMKTGALIAPLGLCGPQRTYRVVEDGDDYVVYDDFKLIVIR